jgi:hypothetical protein
MTDDKVSIVTPQEYIAGAAGRRRWPDEQMADGLRDMRIAVENLRKMYLGMLIAQTGIFITLVGIIIVLWAR